MSGRVLVMVADAGLRDRLRTLLARDGLATEPCADETDCARCIAAPDVEMIIADLGPAPGSDPEALRARFIAANSQVQIVFLFDAEHPTPQGCAMYCRDDAALAPQGLADAIRGRLAAAGSRDTHRRLLTLHDTTLGFVATTALSMTRMGARVGAIEARVDAISFSSLWARLRDSGDPLLKRVIASLVAALLAGCALLRASVLERYNAAGKIPLIEERIETEHEHISASESRLAALIARLETRIVKSGLHVDPPATSGEERRDTHAYPVFPAEPLLPSPQPPPVPFSLRARAGAQ